MTPQQLADDIKPLFDPLKSIIDSYPNAISMEYVDSRHGYVLTIDSALIEKLKSNDRPPNNIKP